MIAPDTALDMSAFKHVVVPLGVVVGMGVANIVSGVARMVSDRERVKMCWEHSVWMAALFLWFVLLWWIAWSLRLVPSEKWTFTTLIFLLIGPALLYLASALILPAVPGKGELDLGARFAVVGRPFFLCLIGAVAWLTIAGMWLGGEPFATPARLNQTVGIALLSVGVIRPTKRVSGVIGVLVLVILIGASLTIRSKLR